MSNEQCPACSHWCGCHNHPQSEQKIDPEVEKRKTKVDELLMRLVKAGGVKAFSQDPPLDADAQIKKSLNDYLVAKREFDKLDGK